MQPLAAASAMTASADSAAGPRWLVPGEVDGFLGLGFDNRIQILLILGICRGVLGYPEQLLLGNLA